MATIRGPRIVNSGLVLSLDAADKKSYSGSGTAWNDISGNNNHVTSSNSPTWNSAGYFSTGATGYFSGNGTSTIPTGNSNYTLMAWIRLNSSWGARRGFFGIGAAGAQNQFTGFRTGDVATVGYLLHYWYANDLYVNNNNANLSIGTWCMVTAQFDGTNRRVWANTTNVGSDTPGSSHNVLSTAFKVAVSIVGDDYLNGDIAIARIYNRALSSTEIQQNFNAQRGRFGI